jgi:hypothetical protein
MSKDRWALFVAGGWTAGSLFVMAVATQNFHTIDWLFRASDNSVFRSLVQEIGEGRTRDLLRYLSSELNRLYFREWSIAQLVLGAGVYALAGSRADARRVRTLVGAMIAIVLLMLAWMTPEITTIGRRLDFVPRTPPPAELGRFWILHAIYTALEVVKLVLGLVVAAQLSRETTRAPQAT